MVLRASATARFRYGLRDLVNGKGGRNIGKGASWIGVFVVVNF